MNGGEALVELLKAAGVSHVFGLLGSSTMKVYGALYDCKQIKYVGVRDECLGTHMADAIGRISRRPGAVLAGPAGPGAANMVTGLIQAKLAYSRWWRSPDLHPRLTSGAIRFRNSIKKLFLRPLINERCQFRGRIVFQSFSKRLSGSQAADAALSWCKSRVTALRTASEDRHRSRTARRTGASIDTARPRIICSQ
jgi:Thiamine pyrophosphate enzyme, N-terminal TPP binding domain